MPDEFAAPGTAESEGDPLARAGDGVSTTGEPPRKPLFEELLDYALYAPIGAAVRLGEGLPELVDKGRNRLGNRVVTARMVGRFAVGTARRRAERSLEPAITPIAALLRQLTGREDERSKPEEVVAEDADPMGETRKGRGGEEVAMDSQTAATRRPVSAEAGAADVGNLAISGYDSLAASQVVPLLDGLTAAERTAVGRYEAHNRGRRTILGRVAQLEAGAGYAPEG